MLGLKLVHSRKGAPGKKQCFSTITSWPWFLSTEGVDITAPSCWHTRPAISQHWKYSLLQLQSKRKFQWQDTGLFFLCLMLIFPAIFINLKYILHSKKYAHDTCLVVFCCNLVTVHFTHILQGYFTGVGAIEKWSASPENKNMQLLLNIQNTCTHTLIQTMCTQKSYMIHL